MRKVKDFQNLINQKKISKANRQKSSLKTKNSMIALHFIAHKI